MSEQEEKMRAEFEAWVRTQLQPAHWYTWQAACAHKEAEFSKWKAEVAQLVRELGAGFDKERELYKEQLAAAQLAIEQKDAALKYAHSMLNDKFIYPRIESAIAIQPSISALNEERAKVLEEAADWFEVSPKVAEYLRYRAAELRNEKKGG